MTSNLMRSAFVIVVLAALGATAFRVYTAPDRIKARRDTARSVCLGSGGEWVKVDRDEVCRKNDAGGNPARKA